MHRLDVVTDRHHRKTRTVKWLRRVARRRRLTVPEQFRRNQEQLRRIERTRLTRLRRRTLAGDQPVVAVMVRHIVRRQQDGIIASRVQRSVRAIDDARLRQHRAGLGAEVVDDELVMRGGVRRRLRLSSRRRERENHESAGRGKAYSHWSSWILLPARPAGTYMQYRESNLASMPVVRLIWSATILAAAALAAMGCRSDSAAQQQAPAAMPPTPVVLVVAAPSPVEDATEYVATLKSLRSTIVQPQIDGQITQIDVVSGQRVARGAPLLQIDPRRQQAAVSSQQAEVAAREAAVGFARQQAQRSSELFAAGAISKQEQEQAATALQTAEANLKALQAQVQQQQVQLRYFTVVAPTAGIVGDVPVRVGNVVTPQTMLTTIDQNETLEVHIDVPVERAAQLKPGLPIRILSSDGSQELAETKATFVSPHVDDQTQSVLVKGTVPNRAGALRASQYVRARIVWKTSDALVVPVTAVLRINGQFFAFVAEDAGGKLVAKQRAIAVGPIAGQNYPILSGIKPGERVVTSGAQKLADGAPIQPANQNPEPKTQNENPEPRTQNPERERRTPNAERL